MEDASQIGKGSTTEHLFIRGGSRLFTLIVPDLARRAHACGPRSSWVNWSPGRDGTCKKTAGRATFTVSISSGGPSRGS